MHPVTRAPERFNEVRMSFRLLPCVRNLPLSQGILQRSGAPEAGHLRGTSSEKSPLLREPHPPERESTSRTYTAHVLGSFDIR